MNNFQYQYTDLLNILLKGTEESKINWKREKVSKYQFYSIGPDNRKILLDKYYAINSTDQIPCINMTSFNADGSIVDEIVLCSTSPEEEEYNLLEKLYDKVFYSFVEKEKKLASPILSEITESYNRLVSSK